MDRITHLDKLERVAAEARRRREADPELAAREEAASIQRMAMFRETLRKRRIAMYNSEIYYSVRYKG